MNSQIAENAKLMKIAKQLKYIYDNDIYMGEDELQTFFERALVCESMDLIPNHDYKNVVRLSDNVIIENSSPEATHDMACYIVGIIF